MTALSSYICENKAVDRTLKRKSLVFIFAIKLLLFFYWAWHFQHFYKTELITSGIAVEMPDTDSYYTPLDVWVKTGEYPTMCRMPGFAPIYIPLYLLLGKQAAYVVIILLQFIASILSVYYLALIASRIMRWRYAFHTTAFVYAISSFVSIWDHTLLSDSFSTSFLIFGIYQFTSYFITQKNTSLFFAGIWITWSVFIRQVAIIAFPIGVFILLLNKRRELVSFFVAAFIFCFSFAVIDGLWTFRNYRQEQLFVPLVKPITSCWSTYTPEFMTLNDLQITWGEDVQYWIAGSSADWFTQQKIQTKAYPFRDGILTSICNRDTLLRLQNDYANSRIAEDSVVRSAASARFMSDCARFKKSYISEHPLDYYLIKRLRMLRQFVFPLRHDNLPGPSFGEMNVVQKIVKSGYLALLLLVNVLALLALLYALIKRNYAILLFGLLPLAITAFLAMILGYIEQRYYVPVYPLAIVLATWFLSHVLPRLSRKLA